MVNDFKYLIELQDIDMKILDLEKSKEEYPQIVESLQNAILQAEAVLAHIKKSAEEIEKEKHTIEDQKENSGLSLTKSQERLNTIKTNKEYDAVHSEIETHKIFMLQADKRLQKLTADAQTVDNKLTEAQAAYDKIVTETRPKMDELNAKIATIDSSIAEVSAGRDCIVEKIKKEYYRAYHHIRLGRKKGRVISLVHEADRKCSVCFQMLEPQAVNRLRRGLELVKCQNCGSVLIWESMIRDNGTAAPAEEVQTG